MKLRYSKLKMDEHSYSSVVLAQVSKSYDSVYEFYSDIVILDWFDLLAFYWFFYKTTSII